MATFFNQATLSYSGGTTNSNITSGEVITALSAGKQALTTTYNTGDDITYVVSLVNTGTTPYTGVTITDDLGAYEVEGQTYTPLTYVADSARLYINGVLQADPTVTGTEPLTVSPVTVPAGGNALLIYSVNVNEFAPLASAETVTNSVTVSGAGLAAPLSADAVITAATAPDLTVSKTLSPTVVNENGAVTYTFVVQNSGNAEATAGDNVQITDTFTPALTNLTVTLNGTPLAEGTDYTYTEGTGLFQTVPGRITVPAATYTRDTGTGQWTVVPGFATLAVSGNLV